MKPQWVRMSNLLSLITLSKINHRKVTVSIEIVAFLLSLYENKTGKLRVIFSIIKLYGEY